MYFVVIGSQVPILKLKENYTHEPGYIVCEGVYYRNMYVVH